MLAKVMVARDVVRFNMASLSQVNHVVVLLSTLKHYDMIIATLAMKIGIWYRTTLRFYFYGVRG
jgi:hypothetical protein